MVNLDKLPFCKFRNDKRGFGFTLARISNTAFTKAGVDGSDGALQGAV